ncbi:MAG: DNA primase [Rhodovarius sp.]|nr:DNA primase [Rhodovarius sp.]
MAIPPRFLEELRARIPLAPLIGRATRLTRAGRNWKGCCPFHQEKTPSFYVYDDHFHCFGCGAHGDAVSFLMQREGLSFLEAVERLAAEAGLELPRPDPEAARRQARARDLHAVLAAAEAAFIRRLASPEGRAAREYLAGRGLTPEIIARFGLGWSGEGRGALAAELRAEGIELPQLIEAGLMQAREERAVDLFFRRVMFPIRDRAGRTIGFGGRSLGEGQPKYVNSPETPLFSKRRSLYGIDLAREAVFRGARLIVVEGYMDVIALHQAGLAGAVAPLGTALTPEQLEALWAISPEPVLCFDGDAAGARAMARAAEVALPLLRPERRLLFASLPAGEDPDSLLRRGGSMEPVLAAARPLHEVLFDLLREGQGLAAPEERAAFRKRLLAAADAIPDRALAAEYRRELLDRFHALTGRPRGAPPPKPAPPRPRPGAQTRLEQARLLLATLLHHPWLFLEEEERLALTELPAGPAAALRAAMLAHPPAARQDAASWQDQLRRTAGVGEALAWALTAPALPAGALPDAPPEEAAACFRHFHARLQGEAALLAELEAARAEARANPSPELLARVQRLAEACAAHRRGEWHADSAEG